MYDMDKSLIVVNNIQRSKAVIHRGIPTFRMLN